MKQKTPVDWIIKTDIVHGNATATEIFADDKILNIQFAADPNGGTEALWWCFRLERVRDDEIKKIRIFWKYFYLCLGLNENSTDQINPVVSYDGKEWKRLPAGETVSYPSGVLCASWEIEPPAKYLELAFCFPHGPENVKDFIKESSWNCDPIGVSSAGREIFRLSNDYGNENKSRPGIYCLSHQHASEMSGAWTLQGFLSEMAKIGVNAPLVWAVPIVNIDGTIEGDYGKDPFPWDINRAWGSPSMRFETRVCMRDIALWQKRCYPVLCMDFHSPGGCEKDGVYTFLSTDLSDKKATIINSLSDVLIEHLGEFAATDFRRTANYPSRFISEYNTSFSKYYNHSDNLIAMTFEIPYHQIRGRILSINDYLEIGSRMAKAVCAYLKKQK